MVHLVWIGPGSCKVAPSLSGSERLKAFSDGFPGARRRVEAAITREEPITRLRLRDTIRLPYRLPGPFARPASVNRSTESLAPTTNASGMFLG